MTFRLLFLFATLIAGAQILPSVTPRSVVNAASLTPQTFPGGAIAQGSVFSVFGINLGPAQPLTQTGFPLATSLGGYSVHVVQGSKTWNALPVYVSAGRVDAVMPSTAPTGRVSIQVLNGLIRGNMAPALVTTAAFGIYTTNQLGFGPGTIQNLAGDGSGSPNNTAAPASPGQNVTLSGTGLGAIMGDDSQPPDPSDVPQATVEVFVGGESATVLSAGRDGCCGGLDQVTFQIPSDALTGCYVPVMVRLNGSVPSNTATLAITSDGSPCSDTWNPLSGAIQTGGKVGIGVAVRSNAHEDIATSPTVDVTSDYAALYLRSEPGGASAFNPLLSLPAPGSCATLAGGGDWFARSRFPGTESTPLLPGGPTSFVVTAPGGSKVATRSAFAMNMTALGSKVSIYKTSSTAILNPGNLILTSSAAALIGGISVRLTMPAAPNWSNRDQIGFVDRTQDLTLNFDQAGDGQTTLIAGGAVDIPTFSTAMFVCVPPPQSTTFTIPALVLSAMPAARPNLTMSKAVLYVGVASPVVSFQTNGLDAGLAVAVALNGRTVAFR